MKKTLLIKIMGLTLVGTAFADCSYTAGTGGGGWSDYVYTDATHRTTSFTSGGSCYSVVNPTYCVDMTQTPSWVLEDLDPIFGWVVYDQGGSCTYKGTAVCQIGGQG